MFDESESESQSEFESDVNYEFVVINPSFVLFPSIDSENSTQMYFLKISIR